MSRDLIALTSSDEIRNRGLEQISQIIVVVSRPSGDSKAIIDAKRKNYPGAIAFMLTETDISASHFSTGIPIPFYGVVHSFVFYREPERAEGERGEAR